MFNLFAAPSLAIGSFVNYFVWPHFFVVTNLIIINVTFIIHFKSKSLK